MDTKKRKKTARRNPAKTVPPPPTSAARRIKEMRAEVKKIRRENAEARESALTRPTTDEWGNVWRDKIGWRSYEEFRECADEVQEMASFWFDEGRALGFANATGHLFDWIKDRLPKEELVELETFLESAKLTDIIRYEANKKFNWALYREGFRLLDSKERAEVRKFVVKKLGPKYGRLKVEGQVEEVFRGPRSRNRNRGGY